MSVWTARISGWSREANVLAQRNLSLHSALRASLLATGNVVVEGSTVVNRRNRLRRAALLLALLALAAIVTGVAASAAKTVIPTRLTGSWQQQNKVLTMVVSPRGKVKIYDLGVYHARFSRITAHRLSISGLVPTSCSGTGTYRWTITKGVPGIGSAQLKLKKIHDACKFRVDQFAGTWRFWKGGNSQP